jgi:inhibitor of cysteine peptidase
MKPDSRTYLKLCGTLALAGILVLMLAAAGCTQTPGGPATPTASPTTTSMPTATLTVSPTQPTWEGLPLYNESDNGATVAVKPGKTFVVALNENPSTGYIWNTTLTQGLQLVTEDFVQNPSTGMAGAGGIHYWVIKGVNEMGPQSFTAIYARPFETVPPAETFMLNVLVEQVLPPQDQVVATYTEADNNSIKELIDESLFAVELPENPTTGYQWNVTLTSGLKLVNESYTPGQAAPGMTGVGGTHTWIVQAVNMGGQTFNAYYARSFESGPPAETYKLSIVVKEG